MKKTWTTEKYDMLRKLYPTTNTYEVARVIGMTYLAVKSKAAKLYLQKSKEYKIVPKDSFWNDENEQILKDKFKELSYDELARLLGCNRAQLKNRIHKLGLLKGVKGGTFKKGHIPANKGKKQKDFMTAEAIERTKASRFKKGQEPHNTNFDGHERISKDGYVEVRVTKGKYVLKHRLVWEAANGLIPNDQIIVFKDGNRMNLSINNLEMISRLQHIENTRNSDGFIAHLLSKKSGSGRGKCNKELKDKLMKFPELIDLKRTQLKLNTQLKNGSKRQTTKKD